MPTTLTSSAGSVTIRNPLLGDSYSPKSTVEFRRARSHDLYSFIFNSGLKTWRFSFAGGMTRGQVQALVNFLKASVAKDVTIVTPIETVVGKILGDFESIHNSRVNSSFNIDIEGING